MGLFGPKLPAEEKNYVKALKKASNLTPKTNAALEDAMKNYPNGWQGYWYVGLFYDLAPYKDGISDPDKAQEYFLKAESAAKGTYGEQWLHNFLMWYRRPADNLYKKLPERYNKARRLGVALMNCYKYNEPVISAPCGSSDDCSAFFSIMCSFTARQNDDYLYNEHEAFKDYFLAFPGKFASYNEREELIKVINKLDKNIVKESKAFDKCLNKKEKGQEANWNDVNDFYSFVQGFSAIYDGPYITDQKAANNNYASEAHFGILYIHLAAYHGCQPAIHELVRLANASDSNRRVINEVLKKDNLDLYLLRLLEKCIKNGDEEAIHLFDMYYND